MQRRVQKYHNVHVCSVATATYGREVLPLWTREGACCRGLPKGFMSMGIHPSQLSGGLIFRWPWVRSSSSPKG